MQSSTNVSKEWIISDLQSMLAEVYEVYASVDRHIHLSKDIAAVVVRGEIKIRYSTSSLRSQREVVECPM